MTIRRAGKAAEMAQSTAPDRGVRGRPLARRPGAFDGTLPVAAWAEAARAPEPRPIEWRATPAAGPAAGARGGGLDRLRRVRQRRDRALARLGRARVRAARPIVEACRGGAGARPRRIVWSPAHAADVGDRLAGDRRDGARQSARRPTWRRRQAAPVVHGTSVVPLHLRHTPGRDREEQETQAVVAGMRALRLDHDPVRARGLLAQYLERHPNGALAEEALALTIEAAAHHDGDAAGLPHAAPSGGHFRALALGRGARLGAPRLRFSWPYDSS